MEAGLGGGGERRESNRKSPLHGHPKWGGRLFYLWEKSVQTSKKNTTEFRKSDTKL